MGFIAGGAIFWIGGYGWWGGISAVGWPLEIAGDEDADAIFGPVDALEEAFDRTSVGGCWSTG